MKKIFNTFCMTSQALKIGLLAFLLLTFCCLSAFNQEALFKNFEELDNYAQKEAAENRFSGVALVAKDGKVVFLKAYGQASKRYRVPNKVNTKFNIGSINKIFTTVAIAKLMEQKKLALDDPLSKFLPEFPSEVAEKVTIKHLLQSQAGWGDYWDNEKFIARRPWLRTVSDYMDFIKDIPLDFEPGTNRQHCNTCYVVLGAVIEKASGQDYYAYIRKNVYEPAGMSNSDSYERDLVVENLATGYTNDNSFGGPPGKNFRRNNIYYLGPIGTPAGGGYSTCEDLHKFVLALQGHQLLSPDYTNYLLNRFEGSIGDPFQPRGPIVWMGGAPGVGAFLGISFQSGHTVIVLSNYDPSVAGRLGEAIFKMLGLSD